MNQATPFVRPEATTWSVDDVLRKAKDGQLYIPLFQRPFRWDADDVRKLFDSIYRGYPIGNLLLWVTNETRGATTTFGPVKFKAAKGNGYLIIDGQQRVTSLVAVLLGSDFIDQQQFKLFFDLENGEFRPARSRERIPDTYLPLPEVADTLRFLEWLQRRKLPGDLVTTANLLVRALRDYRLPVYLVHTQEERQIREIFERMNTTGKRLRATDVFGALQRGREGDLGALAERLGKLGFGAFEEGWVLKAFAAVAGIDVTRLGDTLKRMPPDDVQSGVESTEQSIQRVIAFLRDDAHVLHIELLPYRYPLVLLTKFFHLIPEPSPSTRNRLARWIWRGAWSEMHARSDAPTMRTALAAITNDEQTTVKTLLEATPKPDKPFELRSHDFRAGGTKLACTVLASVGPRHLATGELLDIPALLDEHGAEAFQLIMDDREDDGRGTENRILHPPIEGSIIEALANASPEARESHLVDRITLEAVQIGDVDGFLRKRKETLQGAVSEFLEVRTTNLVYKVRLPRPK